MSSISSIKESFIHSFTIYGLFYLSLFLVFVYSRVYGLYCRYDFFVDLFYGNKSSSQKNKIEDIL